MCTAFAFFNASMASAAEDGEAHGMDLGIGVGAADVVNAASGSWSLGLGFAGHGGYAISLGEVVVVPEIALDGARFSLGGLGAEGTAWLLGVKPGVRFAYSLGELDPWVAAHVGYMHGQSLTTVVYPGAPTVSTGSDQVGWDLGIGALYGLANGLGLGAFAAYNAIVADTGVTKYVSFGLTARLRL